MSGSMRAQFQLDLVDGMSAPVERIERVIGTLQATLDRMIRAVNPFDELSDPIPRAARAVSGFTEAVEATTASMAEAASGATRLGEALTEAGAEATGAAQGISAIGVEAEESAARAVSAMDRINAAVRSVGGAAGGSGGDGGRFGRVGAAANHFHESVQRGVGNAFAAAMEGFGIIAPIHAAAEYDNTLAHIGIGLDQNDPQSNAAFVADYRRRIDSLARQTGQRGGDLAEAAGFFSREGYRGDQLNAVLPVVAQIATAYNAAPDAVAKSTFALQESLHVSNGALGGSLASLALAGKSADLPFESLAPLLPQVAAQAGMLGLSGRSGVDDLASALAVVRKSTGTEGEAVTDARRFLSDIISPHVNNRFRKFGVDLYNVEDRARRTGGDPMMAVMQQVDRLSRHGQDRRVLGTLFGNQESQGFVQALLAHWDQYTAIHQRTSGADQSVINRDYNTGRQTTLIQLNAFEEALAQLERRIGTGFVPVLKVATAGLDRVLEVWDRLDKAFPHLIPTILTVTGGVLAFTVALTAIGAIAGPLAAGFGLAGAAALAFLSPIGLIVTAFAGLGLGLYELHKHIDVVLPAIEHIGSAIGHMLASIWSGIPGFLKQEGHYLAGVIADPLGRNVTRHYAPLHPSQPLQVHVTTDPGVHVAAQPHPSVRVTTRPAPATGRMVNRP